MYIAALGYALVTLVFVAPLINYVHLADASYGGDSRLLIWTLAWDAHALLSGTPLFDANMFHPAPGALKWAEHHIGLGLFALPVYALTANPVLAYWTIWLLSFPLNALAMYALAWRLTGGRRAAAMAGLIYGFCFFRMHHGHGHIQMLWTWALPLIPLALERWLHRPTARTTTTVAALVLIQALTSWYLAVFTGLLCLITAVTLTRVRDITARHMRHAAVAVAAAAVPLAWFARPYFALRAPGVGEVLGLSADAAAYLLPPENTWIGQWILTNTTVTPREIWGEQTLYAGYTAIALAIAGAWALARGRTSAAAGADRLTSRLTTALLVTGGVALLLSWGPGTSGLAPFDWLTSVPGMAILRAPARFALLVMLAVAVLAAYGTAVLVRRWDKTGSALVAGLAAAFLGESFLVGFPAGRPPSSPIPQVYHHLTTLPPGAVLSLPTYRATPEAFLESDYLLYSTAHWRPIVNGFGRQEPPAHADNMTALAGFPSPEAIRRARELGVRYVILHVGRASGLQRAVSDAARTTDVELLRQFGDDYLYRVR